jgi:hypothetical protein
VPHTLTLSCVRSLAVGLTLLLTFESATGWAQEPVQPKLNIVIVEGDEAINNIRQRTAREPIVQVEDENHKPVAGAAVVFLTPQHGPSAVFADGTHSTTVMTDANGRAIARGLRPNNAAGKFQIRVSASYQGQTASTTISQTNALGAAGAAAGGISGKVIGLLVGLAAGGAVAGIIIATRGGSKPVTVTPGTPTVGGPNSGQ